ncbi:hypothetical protein AVEN_150195-1, partial [Araneus ventricosus]
NSEAKFYQDGVQRGYLKKLSDDQVLPYPVSKGSFQRQRKSEKKQCYILIEKVKTLKAYITRRAIVRCFRELERNATYRKRL